MPTPVRTAPKRTPIRRAVFVVDHPDLGRSVISRDPFRRKVFGKELLRAKDECPKKGSLVEIAYQALAHVFKGSPLKLERRGMFSSHGMCYQPVESTVFMVDMHFEYACRLLDPNHYTSLEEHRLRGFIEPILPLVDFVPLRRGIG